MPAPASSKARFSAAMFGNARGEIRHVERSGHAVDQADADQEQQRGGEVDDDVVQPGLDARRARAVQRQPVGRGEQQLEEDEQVEEIAGQERAVEAHQQELEQRMEMRAGAMPAREREHHGGGPRMLVSSSMRADRRSTTSTIPNGAGQSPSR